MLCVFSYVVAFFVGVLGFVVENFKGWVVFLVGVVVGVVKTPGVLGGRARVAGTRIAVSHVVALVKAGFTVEDVLREYPGLTREQVEEALRYYEEHRGEIDAELEDEERLWRAGVRYSKALLSDA